MKPPKNIRKTGKKNLEVGTATPSSRATLPNEEPCISEPVQNTPDYFNMFIQSRQAMHVTIGTIKFYKVKLSRYFKDVDITKAGIGDIERFLLQFNNAGNRHCYFRALSTFYNWREQIFGLASPMKSMRAPKLPKLNLPSLTREQVFTLINAVRNIRNKALIALFTESGLRLTELVNIELGDIDWESRTIRVLIKGRKDALAAFGDLTEKYLKQWLSQYQPQGNIWGIKESGVSSMLRRLREATGKPCNAHTFRRTFACLLRKAGIDVMTIKDLGRWESLEMVQRYTRSINFKDSMKFYKGPLS
jgi:integrase